MKKLVIAAVSVALLAGCATRGANYVPLVDMKGKDYDTFDTDVKECQAYAKQRMDGAQGALAGAILGAALGAALAPRGYRNQVAGHGAAAGALTGGIAATDNQETITRRCLFGRGYNVLN